MTVVATVKVQCNTCHQMASLASELYKIQFRPGLRPGPHWGSLRRSPRPPNRQTPSPFPTPSTPIAVPSAPTAPRF